MEPSLGQNSVEDVSWLCSLSESELDLLISLKKLIMHRARMIGHEELAEKFDLKVLRALGFVLMECIKEKVKDLSLTPGSVSSAAFMESCNLLNCEIGEVMSLEEIKACIGLDVKKGGSKRLIGFWDNFVDERNRMDSRSYLFCYSIAADESMPSQKQKFDTSGL